MVDENPGPLAVAEAVRTLRFIGDERSAGALLRDGLERCEGLGLRPHGRGTLLALRLEKGHIVVGQDTDYDSTPRRIHHEWAARLDKRDYIGLTAVRRTNEIPLDRQLVGLEMELPAPIEEIGRAHV